MIMAGVVLTWIKRVVNYVSVGAWSFSGVDQVIDLVLASSLNVNEECKEHVDQWLPSVFEEEMANSFGEILKPIGGDLESNEENSNIKNCRKPNGSHEEYQYY